MRTSESTEKIAPALLAAQRAMKHAAKTAENPHFKSRYADLAAILEAVKGPLNAAGITVLQGVTSDATGVMVETTLLHESTQWIADTLFLPVPQQTPQAYGSAITYGRRYSLQSMVALPAEDDDGNKASEVAPKKIDGGARQTAVDEFERMSPEQQKFIQGVATQTMTLFEDDSTPAAFNYCEGQRLNQEQKLALWSLLPSPVRTALKAEGELGKLKPLPKHKPTPAELGSQA